MGLFGQKRRGLSILAPLSFAKTAMTLAISIPVLYVPSPPRLGDGGHLLFFEKNFSVVKQYASADHHLLFFDKSFRTVKRMLPSADDLLF